MRNRRIIERTAHAPRIMGTPNKNGFLLLYRSDESYNQLSLEELQGLMRRNKAWFEQLAAQGKITTGQALERMGATISGKNGQFVSDGPFAESKEAIGGYLLLNIATLEEAIAIARTSPGLGSGVSIEVRPVADECPLEARARELCREQQLLAV
jgi:hypothetical protein